MSQPQPQQSQQSNQEKSNLKEKQINHINQLLNQKMAIFRANIHCILNTNMDIDTDTKNKFIQILCDTPIEKYKLEDLQTYGKKSRWSVEDRCYVVDCTFKKIKNSCYCRAHIHNSSSSMLSYEQETLKEEFQLYNYQNINYLVNKTNQIIHPQDYLKKQKMNYDYEHTNIPRNGLATDIPRNGLATTDATDIPRNGLATDIPRNGLATDTAATGFSNGPFMMRVIGRYHPDLPENQRYELFDNTCVVHEAG